MPGVVGIATPTASPEVPALFSKLVAAMRRERLLVEAGTDPRHHWAIGRVHLGILQPEPQLDGSSAVKVLFHGDLHNEPELRTVAAREGIPVPDGVAGLIGAMYTRLGASLSTRLRGAFCAVIVDETRCHLILISDLLGSYPIYWFKGAQRLVFASELKSVLRAPDVPRVLDCRAVADYVHFGFVQGNRTLARDVELLPAASVLTYCWRDGSHTLARYRRFADFFQPTEEPKAQRFETLRATFTRAVHRAQANGHGAGLSLSGGLDTRAILSAIDHGRGPVSTYTLGVRGCADHVIADRLASLARTRHRFFELDERYLSNFLPNLMRMVSLTDGMYLSHGLTEMLALAFLQDAGFGVLLRGHCGELAKASVAWPFHVDAQVHTLRSTDELIAYLLRRIDYVGTAPISEIFADDWGTVLKEGPRESMHESTSGVALTAPDLCSYLYLEQLHRRFTAPSLEIFRSRLEVRLPFADEVFLRELFATPPCWREQTGIHRYLIRPDLLAVRNSNTGAPGDAGPLREMAFDKLNSLLKRLNVYGFRHYHRFDAWIRHQLLESVETVLLDPATLRRGMFREPALRRLIAGTRDGTTNSGYLFQVLLNVELWQRENFS